MGYIFVLIYMVVIFYFSSLPIPMAVGEMGVSNFFLHILEYYVLGFLLFNAKGNFIFSASVGSAYGLIDEIHQYFVPYRFFDIFDLAADVIGIILGIAAFLIIKKLIKYSKNYRFEGP